MMINNQTSQWPDNVIPHPGGVGGRRMAFTFPNASLTLVGGDTIERFTLYLNKTKLTLVLVCQPWAMSTRQGEVSLRVGYTVFCQRDNENACWHTRHLEPISNCFPNCSWWRYYRAAYVILEQNSTYSGLGMSTSILFVSLSKRQRECSLTYQAPWAMSTRQGEVSLRVGYTFFIVNPLCNFNPS